jgi:hypothetical protein
MKNRCFLFSAMLCAALCAALVAFAGCDNPSSETPQSGDASLKSLAFLDGGGQTLDLTAVPNAAGDTWTVSVAHSVAAVTVTATPNHASAVAAGDSGVRRSLAVGPNNFSITITAENGTAMTYTVIIARDASDEDREAASAFEADHAAVLALTTATVTATHEAAVNAAITAYNALSAGAKAQVGAEKKTLLDSLKARIDTLNAGAADTAAVNAFRTTHGAALLLTVDNVAAANEAAVDAAIAAWNVLSEGAQTLASADKSLLDRLKARITAIKTEALAGQADKDAAAAFRTDYAAVLALNAGTVAASNETAVNTALNVYNSKNAVVKNLLSLEKALLDELSAQIAEIKAATANQTAANAFKTARAAVLALTVDTVAVSNEGAINQALSAYNALDPAVRTLLTTEKALLDSLKTKVDELKVEAANQAAANSFKTSHSAALALTTETATPANETIVNNALTAYGNLAQAVKDLLTTEKALLDTLKDAIADKAEAAVDAAVAAFRTNNPVAAKTVNTVTSGDEAALNAALVAYDALSPAAKAKLLPLDRAVLEALGSKIAELKTAEANQAAANGFKTAHKTALDLTTANVTTANTGIVNEALATYDALSQAIKDLLGAEKGKLDTLKTKIDQLQAGEDQVSYTAFNTAHGTILARDPDSLTIPDTAVTVAVDAAWAAWNGLTVGARELAPEGTAARVQALKTKVDELNAPSAVTDFLAVHGAFLNTNPLALTLADAASLTAARSAYNALSNPAKGQLTGEYAKLQVLEAKMAALRAVNAFKTAHAVALALTTGTVMVSDEARVDAALTAHNNLSADAKALVTAEKTLLDTLKVAIRAQKPGEASVSITNGQMEDEDFTLAPISLNKLSPAATRIKTFELEPGSYTNIRWSVDTADLGWADDEESFAFDAADWTVGDHVLSMTVEKGGRSWSKNIIITVSNDTSL